MTAINKRNPLGVVAPGGVLDRIIAAKAERLAQAKNRVCEADLVKGLADLSGRWEHGLEQALKRPERVRIIAEIKRTSPSRGIIRTDLDPAKIASEYQRGGAVAISVLAEEDFFGGSLDDIRMARKTVDLPLLRKDFIFDGYQVYEAAMAGADALLLIVAMLEDGLLAELIGMCRDISLDALVEVHTAEEMDRAGRAGAKLIGVNNRDLRTFDVRLDTSIDLAKIAPKDAVLVSESGIKIADDIRRLLSVGYSGFLIGEHFMHAPEPGAALESLIEAV